MSRRDIGNFSFKSQKNRINHSVENLNRNSDNSKYLNSINNTLRSISSCYSQKKSHRNEN